MDMDAPRAYSSIVSVFLSFLWEDSHVSQVFFQGRLMLPYPAVIFVDLFVDLFVVLLNPVFGKVVMMVEDNYWLIFVMIFWKVVYEMSVP